MLEKKRSLSLVQTMLQASMVVFSRFLFRCVRIQLFTSKTIIIFQGGGGFSGHRDSNPLEACA